MLKCFDAFCFGFDSPFENYQHSSFSNKLTSNKKCTYRLHLLIKEKPTCADIQTHKVFTHFEVNDLCIMQHAPVNYREDQSRAFTLQRIIIVK